MDSQFNANFAHWIFLILFCVCPKPAAAKENTQIEQDKAALAVFRDYVGEWKGMGQPKSSTKDGPWGTELNWSWKFEQQRAVLVFEAVKDRYFKSGQLEPTAKENVFKFTATAQEGGKSHTYAGSVSDGKLALLTEQPLERFPARITVSLVAKGKRMLFLYELKEANGSYEPLAEAGLTRKGSGFGQEAQGPECVVTGGLGTIPVQHKGKTWYVCCGGCKTEFMENPDGTLLAYEKRKAAEQAAKEKK